MTAPTNYAVAPGEYLDEWLEDAQMNQSQAARQLGYSRKHVNELVSGKAPVTDETAIRLERLTGVRAEAWLRYEALYRADLARLRDQEDLADHAGSIHPEAAKYLRSMGMTAATLREPGQLVSDFLMFHRCGTWLAYVQTHQNATTGDFALGALAESSSELDVTLVSTWLRAGELSDAYERGRGWRYNAAALTAMLPELRERAARPDPELLGDLAEMVSRAGVVLTFVAPPNKLPLYGMTRWIDKRVPVIQQTGRRQKDGFLIWAFFHEIGHVLNDPRGDVHLDFTTEKKRTSAAETAANKFAFEVLFGADGLNPFKDLRWDSDIRRVAHQVGVSPGVAVHQLHRRRYLPYNVGNSLLVELGTD